MYEPTKFESHVLKIGHTFTIPQSKTSKCTVYINYTSDHVVERPGNEARRFCCQQEQEVTHSSSTLCNKNHINVSASQKCRT